MAAVGASSAAAEEVRPAGDREQDGEQPGGDDGQHDAELGRPWIPGNQATDDDVPQAEQRRARQGDRSEHDGCPKETNRHAGCCGPAPARSNPWAGHGWQRRGLSWR
jgi:hypothetical protein